MSVVKYVSPTLYARAVSSCSAVEMAGMAERDVVDMALEVERRDPGVLEPDPDGLISERRRKDRLRCLVLCELDRASNGMETPPATDVEEAREGERGVGVMLAETLEELVVVIDLNVSRASRLAEQRA